MKVKGVISILLSMMLLVMLLVPVFATEPTEELNSEVVQSNSSYSTDAQIGILGSEQLIENADAVFLYEANSDTLMYAWNPDKEMIPSSLVKIMTALVAIESGKLKDAVTVRQSVLDMIPKDAVKADLKADEVITLEDLVYCMMVGSANDAAAVIAEHVGGSQAEFVKLMNNRATEIGCTGTMFTNAHGIQDNAQYTTARDIAKILEIAIENDTFVKIFGTTYYIVPETNKSKERNMLTGNYLITQEKDDVRIYYDARVTGSRTGVNNDGKRCLASVSESNGMKLICVVLGSLSTYHEESMAIKVFGGYNETRELLDIGYGGYKTAQVLYDGQVLLQREVLNGTSKLSLGSNVSVSAVLPENVTKSLLTYRYADLDKDITAPVKKGSAVSSVEVWYGGLCVAKADLFAMNSVAEAKPLVVEEEDAGFPWWGVVLIVVGTLAIVVFVFYNLRRGANRRSVTKKRKKLQHTKQRRRGH